MEPGGRTRPRPELVYQLAGALGTELRGLESRFGHRAAAGLVPLVVRALELLEGAVGAAPGLEEERAGGRAPDSPAREAGDGLLDERRLLRQLKEVTDRQRDQLRAQSRDLQRRAQEAEALQEQLQRLLQVNAELRTKLAAVQVQLRAARQRAADAERSPRGQAVAQEAPEGTPAVSPPAEAEPAGPGKPNGFSREEVGQILQERNELKANLFLLQEELDYYQRELLTDQRVPGLLLDAMKLTVKKQRRKIKAKMLGTTDDPESSEDAEDDDEDEAAWLPPPGMDGTSPASPPESRIRSFFSFWYRGSSEPTPELPKSADLTLSQEQVRGEEKEMPPLPPEPCGGIS